MDALDGNAIGGLLLEVFGIEMTAARGECTHCDATAYVAELQVYTRGPGVVARCRSCGGLLMVLTEIRGVTCVDLRWLALRKPGLI
jgi:hypothetical protein